VPWRGYRFEPLVLVLVGFAALSLVHGRTAQDVTRVGVTYSIVNDGSLELHEGARYGSDFARFGGRYYTDKAPGMTFLAVPPFLVSRVVTAGVAPEQWHHRTDYQLWWLRLATCGVLFLACVFLVGRLAEGLVAGTGAATAATLGLGTLMSPLAATMFDHVPAAALGFAAFVAASRRRPALAGLCAGFGVLVEYQAALVAAIVFLYVVRDGVGALARYAVGSLPPLALLGLYDQLAFGSPFHLSYGYVGNRFAERQKQGFFGIGVPRLHGLQEVLVGYKGLLVFSPVLLAAAAGLLLLARRHRAEALVCGAVTLLFLLSTSGYFLPYGGTSPGPRFFVPALPFLALGLPFAFARWPLPTLLLAFTSVLLTALDSLTWSFRPDEDTSFAGVWNHRDFVHAFWVAATGSPFAGAIVTALVAVVAVAIGAVALRPAVAVKAS
jgi:hypothetical protein